MVSADSTVVCSFFRQFYLLAILLLLLPYQLQAAAIEIESASTENNQGVYQLNADIRYELNDEVLDALNNGVTITMLVTIKLERQRAYLWNESIAELLQRYELKYHALSGQYIVKKLAKAEQQSYLSLSAALRALGSVRELDLIKQDAVQNSKNMVVKIHSELDTNALPAPLRPVAWLEGYWQLSSEWFSCPL
ncbi:MAG: DUF4390 domain-containing protein [Sulfuriflexus sp.]|nr:DUF4390 domain-containing protein [Sulfuriflexus sp.]